MKASELIKQLQNLVDEYGDLPVEIPCWGDDSYGIDYDDAELAYVYAYDLGRKCEYTVIQIS